MHDLAVVGAGPVGSYLASLCAGRMDVVVFEEDREAGNKACSGLVSPRFMNMIPSSVKKGVVQHKVRGAKISFLGAELEFRKSGPAAYIVDRNLLDRRMADYAAEKGADIRFGEKVVSVKQDMSSVKVTTAKHNFESRLLAGCDGARSVAAKSIGSKAMELLNGLIIYQDSENFSDTVEMWFDKSLVKDGFFWKIPRGSTTEYGCIGHKLSFPVLERFFEIDRSTVSGREAAPIPLGISKTVGGRILLAGDAASQTKPWSGGGLTYGFLAAKAGSEIIASVIRTGDISKLALYEDEWKRLLLKDINAGLMIREIYKDLNLGVITSLMERAEGLRKESDRIDFDFPFTSAFGRL